MASSQRQQDASDVPNGARDDFGVRRSRAICACRWTGGTSCSSLRCTRTSRTSFLNSRGGTFLGDPVILPHPQSFDKLPPENRVEIQVRDVSEEQLVQEEDDVLIRNFFNEVAREKEGILSKEEMQQTLTRLRIQGQVGIADEDAEKLLKVAEGGGMDFDSFQQSARAIPRLKGRRINWIKTLGIEMAFCQLLPIGNFLDPLSGIRSMKDNEIEEACRQAAGNMIKLVKAGIEKLNKSKEQKNTAGNSKFALPDDLASAKFGELEKIYQDPQEGITLDLTKFEALHTIAMQKEHCQHPNADDEFASPNYGAQTTPKQEWEFVVAPNPELRYPHTSGSGHRTAEPLDKFLTLAATRRAKLTRAEVISLRLCSGPLYVLYNAALRGYPRHMVDKLKGNTYETTIFTITSAIAKISRAFPLPPTPRLYVGLGGAQLPPQLWKADEAGGGNVGGVEQGLLSCTVSIHLALPPKGRRPAAGVAGTLPLVLEVELGRADGGAGLQAWSQYPQEEEVLLPPGCILERAGPPRLEWVPSESLMVSVIPIRVHTAPPRAATLDGLYTRRRDQLLEMLATFRGELVRGLQVHAEPPPTSRAAAAAVAAAEPGALVSEFDAVLQRLSAAHPKCFLSDERLLFAVGEALRVKSQLQCKQAAVAALRRKDANDRQLRRCAEAPYSDFRHRVGPGDWGLGWEKPFNQALLPATVNIPLPLPATLAAALWDQALRDGAGVKKVTLGREKVDPGSLRKRVSVSAMGLKDVAFENAVAGLVMSASASITSLDLSGCEFHHDMLVRIARIAGNAPTIKTFCGVCVVGDESMPASEIVRQGDFSSGGAAGWYNGRQEESFVESREVRKLTAVDWAFVSSRITFNGWTRLDLRNCNLDKGSWNVVLETLETSSTLRALNAYPEFTTLVKGDIVEMDLSNTKDMAYAVVRYVHRSLSTLTSLNLSRCSLGKDDVAVITDCVQDLDGLRALKLGRNNLGPEGTTVVANCLQHLGGLHDLRLSENDLGAAGATAIADGLRHVRGLKKLFLFGNNLGHEGGTVLSHGLRYLTGLEELYLSENKMGKEGVNAVRDSLVHLTTLRMVDLMNNGLKGDGKREVRLSLTSVQSLAL